MMMDATALLELSEDERKRIEGVQHRAVVDPERVEWEDGSPWPILPEAALHGLAGDVVRTIEPHTEADPVNLLMTFLTAAGSMIGPGPHLRVGAIRHPARLFTLAIGDSAKARKGQGYAEAMGILIEAEPETVENIRVSGLASGEGLIGRLRDRDDGETVEKRALIHEPEFARVLAASGREGATLSAILRDAWDGSTLSVLTRKEPMQSKGAHVSFLGHCTREELTARLDSVEIANGFANRFLIAAVRRSKLLPSGGSLSYTELAALGRRMREALVRARKIGEVRRSPAFVEAWDWLYRRFSDEAGLLGALLARAEAHTLRLSLAYCLLDGSSTLCVEHLIAGYAVWSYCEASARHIFGIRLGDDVQQRLLDELRAVYPDGLDRTDQQELFGRHASVARLKDARAGLVSRRFAEEKMERTEGRSRAVLYALPCEKSELSEKSPQHSTLISLMSLFSQAKESNESAETVPDECLADDGEAFL